MAYHVPPQTGGTSYTGGSREIYQKERGFGCQKNWGQCHLIAGGRGKSRSILSLNCLMCTRELRI